STTGVVRSAQQEGEQKYLPLIVAIRNVYAPLTVKQEEALGLREAKMIVLPEVGVGPSTPGIVLVRGEDIEKAIRRSDAADQEKREHPINGMVFCPMAGNMEDDHLIAMPRDIPNFFGLFYAHDAAVVYSSSALGEKSTKGSNPNSLADNGLAGFVKRLQADHQGMTRVYENELGQLWPVHFSMRSPEEASGLLRALREDPMGFVR
ncbi:hypothetical protein HYS47_04475, partial [Candidatus Woesearchaeota archaeon]|nr:hypothetical protein [Candidatus Woesearchaeota archaeon]